MEPIEIKETTGTTTAVSAAVVVVVDDSIMAVVLEELPASRRRKGSALVSSLKTSFRRKVQQRRSRRRSAVISPIPEDGGNHEVEEDDDDDYSISTTATFSEDFSTQSSLTGGTDDYDYGLNNSAGASVSDATARPLVHVVTPTRHNRRRRTASLDASEQERVVSYDHPHHHHHHHQPASLQESVGMWLEACEALARSPEMAALVHSTCHVAVATGDLAVRTACLPVTLPLHIVGTAADLVVGTTVHVLGTVTGALLGLEQQQEDSLLTGTQEEQREPHNPIFGMVNGVFGAPGFILDVAGKIKDEIGSVALQVVAPALGIDFQDDCAEPCCAVSSDDSSSDEDAFLDRLRLDYDDYPAAPSGNQNSMDVDGERPTTNKTSPSPRVRRQPLQATSAHLLRVDDLGVSKVTTEDQVPSHMFYIDLSPKHSNQQELDDSLERLVTCGLSFIANHATVRLNKPYKPIAEMEWNAEGSTKKLLRKMASLPSIDRLKLLEKDQLIWSGKYKNEREHYGGEYSFFLARGIFRKSPREFLELLWDNTRTAEYNNFCLGRETVLEIDDKVLQGASRGTKVIQSETRVPFTGKSVHLSCLMHVCPLEGPDQGFVIVSRSLDTGLAGTHVGSRNKINRGRKGEILWGVNVIRCVPNNPQLTDLTSLSQVGSPMVPKFLSQRIGVAGIEDFYRNIRADPSKQL